MTGRTAEEGYTAYDYMKSGVSLPASTYAPPFL